MKTIQTLALCALMSTFGGQTASAQRSTTSWHSDNGNGTFTNPLFYEEFSDPDVIRVGDDYYLAGTTMHCVPGVTILHSKDLVNWELASYCFDRFAYDEAKFKLEDGKSIYGQGIWAPCIRYNNGTFYIFSNMNGVGLQVFTSKDIKGPWELHKFKGSIHDLSVLFDDDGKIYAIYGYGDVRCVELKPDMSGPVEGTERIIIHEGSSVGEGHHIYKIDGMYYILSADFMPMGRMTCARSKSIDGPYEVCVVSGQETYGYHPGRGTVFRGRIPENGDKIGISDANENAIACSNLHQGGMLQLPNGDWWAISMLDFHCIGRTLGLSPVTWKDGWPMFGLEGNPGRSPRTWLKPATAAAETETQGFAPFERSDNFNGKALNSVWQWNHNPDDAKWKLANGKLRLSCMPAHQLMWARNTLTQRVIGPSSTATVTLATGNLKDGDIAGLGNINVPCSWMGVRRNGNSLTLICYEQAKNDSIVVELKPKQSKVWLRAVGKYDDEKMHYEYSTDGKTFTSIGNEMLLSYQLTTFQGSRLALFAFNDKMQDGGYAEFDDFTLTEHEYDRTGYIPFDKKIRIINLATEKPANALRHGFLHDSGKDDKSTQTIFHVIDCGKGQVKLKCEDGRYVSVAGEGLAGDVQLTTDEAKAEVFMWQDYLNHEFMLLSMKHYLYIGKNPTDGSPYSCQFRGADPARKNGAVLRWEEL